MKLKTGLGKGLDTLIPARELPLDVSDTKMLRLSQIEPNKDQPRKQFDKESLEDLAGSIKQYGIIEPIIVCKKSGYYEIVAGERRWRAAKLAGLKEIPVVVRDYSEKEIAEISLIENIQRENLNPIEEAIAFKSLIEEYDLTQEELSERISKSRSQIANTMRLLNLHVKVQKLLTDGKISQGHARALLAIENKSEQLEAAQLIVKEQLSVRQTENLVKKILEPSRNPSKTAKVKNSVFYKDLERQMSEQLGTKVRINQKEPGKGRIEINFFSEEELDRLFTAINSR